MIILNIQSETSLIKAQIPNLIAKDFYDNHRVSLKAITGQQTLSSSYSEVITIQYDPELIAPIIENADV